MMTTNTDQQVAQSETPEQIAERITRRWGSQYRTQLKTAIVEALRNERERCAKVADAKAAYHVLRHAEFLSGHARMAAGHSGSKAEACSEVASAIREGR